MKVFSAAQVRRYQRAAEAHAVARFPEKCRELGDAEVKRRAELMVRKTGEYGIQAESDGFTYLEFMFVLSPDFDESVPWAREIFTHPRMSGPQKMELLYKRYRYELTQSPRE